MLVCAEGGFCFLVRRCASHVAGVLTCGNTSKKGLCGLLGLALDGTSVLLGAAVVAALLYMALRGGGAAPHSLARRAASGVAIFASAVVVLLSWLPPPPLRCPFGDHCAHQLSARQSHSPPGPQVWRQIATHLSSVRASLDRATACSAGKRCSSAWRQREAVWRNATLRAESTRLMRHARDFRSDFLPSSTLTWPEALRLGLRPFIYWQPDFACASEAREGANADGGKWVCGGDAHPPRCEVLSLGSALDNTFEHRMHVASGCRSYIVDPTLDGAPLQERTRFATRLRKDGSSFNGSVGVGDPSAVAPFAIVSLDTLVGDRYGMSTAVRGRSVLGAPRTLSVLKVDIEGHEFSVMAQMARLCRDDILRVDSLHVEIHLTMTTLGALHRLFDDARACGLALHHREDNELGCSRNECAEFSWVSLAHARRVEARLVGEWAA